MNDRGEYRTIFCSFGDDPDVHALSGDAVKLLVFLKLELPPTGIGIAYTSMYAEKMQLNAAGLELVFEELERPKPASDFGWIARQRNVVWIVNALKFDVNLMPANKKKHVPYVHRLIAELDPKLDVVRTFKSHYREWFPNAPKSNWKPTLDRVSNTLSNRVSHRVSDDRVSDRVSIPRSITGALQDQDQKQHSGDLGRERATAPNPRPPTLELPPAAKEFGRQFYADASPERVRDVRRQLRATLNGGARFGKARVLAHSAERLEAKCREVMAEGVKDSDKAIVVLLRKLGDVGNDEDSPTERAQEVGAQERAADTAIGENRLALALAWLDENPERATEVDALPEIRDASKISRGILRNAAVLKAWTDAGEPHVQPAGAP